MPEEESRHKLGQGIVSSAIAFPFRHLKTLAEIGIGPTLIVAALYYVVWVLLLPEAGSLLPEDLLNRRETFLVLDLLLWAAIFVAGIIVAVGIHRFIVLDEQPRWSLIRFRKWEAAYLLAIVTIAFIYLAALAVVGEGLILSGIAPDTTIILRDTSLYEFLQNPALHIISLPIILLLVYPLQNTIASNVVLFSGILLLFLFLRLALIFPHAAVTGKLSFSEAWKATRGNFWGLFFRMVLFGLFVILASLLLAVVWFVIGVMSLKDLNNETISSIVFPIAWAISFAFNAWIFIMSVALISYAYQDLVPRPYGTRATRI